MKRPVNKFGIAVLAVAAAIAVLLSVMTYFSATSAPLPNVAGMIAAPFRAAGAAITEKAESLVDYITEFDALKAENEELKLRIAEMEAEVRQAKADRDENVRLRELLELRRQRRDLHWESARVVKQEASNWSSMLTVNKGTAQGVEVGTASSPRRGSWWAWWRRPGSTGPPSAPSWTATPPSAPPSSAAAPTPWRRGTSPS